MENQYADIEKLTAFINDKKNKKAPYKEADEFCDAWLSLAKREGFNDDAERYLYEGLIYSGARPFKILFVHTAKQERESLYYKLFNGKYYGKNNDITFRLLTSLLANFINDEHIEEKYAADLIKRIPKFAVNQEGKPLGTANKIIIHYFFEAIVPNRDFKAERMELNPKLLVPFQRLLINAIYTSKNTKLNERAKRGIAAASKWFHLDDFDTSITTEQKPISAASPSAEKAARNDVMPETAKDPNKIPEEKVPQSSSHEGVMPQADLKPLFTKIYQQLEAKAAESNRHWTSIDMQLSNLNTRLDKVLEENNNLRNTNLSYLEKNVSLQKKVDELTKQIDEKNNLIDEMNEMASVVSKDNEKKSEEVMKRLAARLQLDYQDFLDAEDVPMTTDLGENTRLQLQSVFDILKNFGIRFE